MSNSINTMAARLQCDVPNAEARIDDAMIAVSSLMTNMVTARREIGVAAKTGHSSILRLAKAQVSLVEVSGDVLRVHGELAEIGREMGAYDLRECPNVAAATGVRLAAVA